MSQIHQSARHDSPCLWFATEGPVVGRVFMAHRNGLVVATKLADPLGGPPMDADDFANHLRREFGVVIEQDRSPASSWPFSEAGESFHATDLVDLSMLTDFQRRVMMATARIPPGELRTYGEVAEGLGQPAAAMAVGQAMKSNPAPLVILISTTNPQLRTLGTHRLLRTARPHAQQEHQLRPACRASTYTFPGKPAVRGRAAFEFESLASS